MAEGVGSFCEDLDVGFFSTPFFLSRAHMVPPIFRLGPDPNEFICPHSMEPCSVAGVSILGPRSQSLHPITQDNMLGSFITLNILHMMLRGRESLC